MSPQAILPLALALAFGAPAGAQHEFWNFETPHVHPLEITPDGLKLLAVNTPDQRLEVYDLSSGLPVHERSVRVGLEPVSVRARTPEEIWVVNHLSDTVTVVDLKAGGRTQRVLATDDEPCDVVFTEERAWVSCSQANTVLAFDLFDLGAEPVRLEFDGEDPRSLAVSPEGDKVYVAFFESGNETTILGGGFALPSPPIASQVVSDPDGPYGGINPPPNAGVEFFPPMNPELPTPPEVSLIVRRDEEDRWYDDNGVEWTDFVSGPMAGRSGRVQGWELLDHDIATIDALNFDVSYAGGMMNLCMAMEVHPSGQVHMVGTDARNEERYEPVLNGRFLEVLSSKFDPSKLETSRSDLNPHIGEDDRTVPQEERDLSIGDPRGIVWAADGSYGFVSGLGSNNVVRIDENGQRIEPASTIEVGEGPTGLAIDEGEGLLYVLNKFSGSISVVHIGNETAFLEIPFFDPTPDDIKLGRKHLYDTHETSGTGVVSCASCHVDGRTDKLCWDLGDPGGEVKSVDGQNVVIFVTEDWHPMKGPMRTQTLQDIIGKEPLHWRGDRDGIEEFNGAYGSLMGDDETLTSEEMQQFEDFLATIRIGPNPYRNLDNSLPTSLPLPGQFTSGSIGPQGLPLPNGNANLGRDLFVDPDREEISCISCHTLPTGIGTDHYILNGSFFPFPLGPNGEHHSRLVHLDGFTNHTLKPAQLRTLYEHIGFDLRQPAVHVGFGFLHDGSIDSLSSFMAPFGVANGFFTDQDVANTIAFLMSFSGSELPDGTPATLNRPPGVESLDAHAAIGCQIVLDGSPADALGIETVRLLFDLAEAGKIGVIATGTVDGLDRSFYFLGNNTVSSDRQFDRISTFELLATASPTTPVVWTAVPFGSEIRMGVDRDADGVFDRDELDQGNDPNDPTDFPCIFEPYPPEEFRVVNVRQRGIDLAWEDTSFSEDGFRILGRAPGELEFTPLGTVGPNETFARVGGLDPATRYDLRVVAFNCAGDSQPETLAISTLEHRPRARAGSPQGTATMGQ